MGNDHNHHEHEHEGTEAQEGVTFNHEGTNYTVSLEAAQNSGLVGNTDRNQLPNGQLILLHPHGHEDNANTEQSIKDKGGKSGRLIDQRPDLPSRVIARFPHAIYSRVNPLDSIIVVGAPIQQPVRGYC